MMSRWNIALAIAIAILLGRMTQRGDWAVWTIIVGIMSVTALIVLVFLPLGSPSE